MAMHDKVRDVLVPLSEYPNIREGATVRDAFALLRQGNVAGRRFRHILVLGARDQLVGVVGMRDLLKAVFPDYLRATLPGRFEGSLPFYPALSVLWDDTFGADCVLQAAKPIGPHVAPVHTTVAPDDPLTKAAYLMVVADQSMLPVVEEGNLIGVIRVIDVFNHAVEAVLNG